MVSGYFPPFSSVGYSSSEELWIDRLAKAIRNENSADIAHYFGRLEPLPKDNLAQALTQYAKRVALFKDEKLIRYKQALQSSMLSIVNSDPSLRENIEAVVSQYFVGDSQARFCVVLCGLAFDQKDRALSLLMCDIMNQKEIFCWDIKKQFSLFIELCSEGNQDGIRSCFALMQRKRPPDYGMESPSDLIREAVDERNALEVILRGALSTKNEDILLYCLDAVYKIYRLRREVVDDYVPLYENVSFDALLTELEPLALEALLSASQQEAREYYVESVLFFLTRSKQSKDAFLEPLVRATGQLPYEAQARLLTKLMSVQPFDSERRADIRTIQDRLIEAFPGHFDLISVTIGNQTIRNQEKKIQRSSLMSLAPERFSRCLEGGFREKNERVIGFISFEGCRECDLFLQFLAYRDETLITESTVIGLLQLSVLNEISYLGNVCVDFIGENLTIEDEEPFFALFTSLLDPESALCTQSAEYILDLKWLFLTYACNNKEVYERIKSQNNPLFLQFLSECDRCKTGNISTALRGQGRRSVTYNTALSEGDANALSDHLASLHLSESILASATQLKVHSATTDKELVDLSRYYPQIQVLAVALCKGITTFTGCAFTKLVRVDAQGSGLTDEGLKALFDQNKGTLTSVNAAECSITTAAEYAARCKIYTT